MKEPIKMYVAIFIMVLIQVIAQFVQLWAFPRMQKSIHSLEDRIELLETHRLDRMALN